MKTQTKKTNISKTIGEILNLALFITFMGWIIHTIATNM